jgi:hypothetical protein
VSETSQDTRTLRAHHALMLLPFIWHLALAPMINDVRWQPWGLPFAMVWQMAGVVLATLVIAVVFAIDQRLDRDGT